MDWLGVRMEVGVTATAGGVSCLMGGCDWRWDGPGDRAAAIEAHRLEEHDYIPAFRFSVRTDEARDSLNAMDDLFTQRELRGAGGDVVDQADELEDDVGVDEQEEELETEVDAAASGFATTDEGPEPEPEQEVEQVGNKRSRRTWTEAEILQAINDWAAAHDGAPPTADDWRNAGDHPTYTTVVRVCGSWGSAMRAAGFEPRSRGGDRSSTREPQGRETEATPRSPSPSPSPQDAVDDDVSDDLPGPGVGTDGAGSRVDDYAAWLAERVDVAALERELEDLERQVLVLTRKADACHQIIAAVRKLDQLEDEEAAA